MPATRLVLVAVVCALAAAPVTPAATPVHPPAPRTTAQAISAVGRDPGRVLARFRGGIDADARRRSLRRLTTPDRVEAHFFGVRPYYVLSVDNVRAALLAAAADRNFHWVEPEVTYRLAGQATGPERAETKIDRAWALAAGDGASLDGAGAVVAVLDSGVDPTNRDLAGRVVDGGDYTRPRRADGSAPAGGTTPSSPHGTAVAALIAGADDDRGIVGGAPQATIRSYKVARASGAVGSVALTDAVLAAAGAGADVINLSLAGPFESHAVRSAVVAASEAGSVVVAAAGNDGSEQPSFPAASPSVLSVGASRRFDDGVWRAAAWTSRSDVDVLAPGAGVTTWWGDQRVRVRGTSYAAAQVSGVLAGLTSVDVSGARARGLLVASAAAPSLTDKIPGIASGAGRLDARRAYTMTAGNRPFFATFVDAGMATSGSSASRDLELLRYSPGRSLPNPTLALLPSNERDSVYYDTFRAGDTDEAAAGDGTLRSSRGTLVRSTNDPGTPYRLVARRDGERTVTRYGLNTNWRTGPDGSFAPNEGWLDFRLKAGSRSGYVVYQGATRAGDRVSIDFVMPRGVKAGRGGPTLLAVWASWDVTADGRINGRDRAVLSMYPPTITYDGPAVRRGRLTFLAPRAGSYLVGVRSFGPDGDGAYRLRPRAPGENAEVVAPDVAHPGTDDYSFPIRLRPAGPRWGATHFEYQWARRVKRADGTWATTAWRTNPDIWSSMNRSVVVQFKGGRRRPLIPGSTYLFRTRSIGGGNPGPWSRVVRTDLPLDDSSPGFRIVQGNRYMSWQCPNRNCYGGRAHTASYGPYSYEATVTRETTHFSVVGRRCDRCAPIRVYIDGRYRTTISRAGRGAHKLLWRSARLSARPQRHTLRLVSRNTHQRPLVEFDAVGLHQ